MIFHIVAIGMTELVILSGNEGLDRFHVHLLQACQFAQFENPIALQLFRCCLILHVADGQTIREPLAAELGEEAGLTHALWAIEYDNAVELDTRFKDTGDCRDNHLSGHCTAVFRVGCAQVIHKQGIHPGDSVPLRQRFKVVPDRMIAALCCDGQQDAFQLTGRIQTIHSFQVNVYRAQIRLIPAGLDLCPGNGRFPLCILSNIDTTAVDVVSDVLELRIMTENQRQVTEGILHTPLLINVQTILPVIISCGCAGFLLGIQITELLQYLGTALLCQLTFRCLVLGGILLHQLHGVGFRTHSLAIWRDTTGCKQMPAHQVKSIAQLTTCRIRSMVRKGILVVVHHKATGGTAANESKAIILLRCRIPIGQDILQYVCHGMRSAESANNTPFFSRILLLTGRVLDAFLYRLRGRPERGIPPISIGFQDFVGIEERLVCVMEKELAVFGRAGPVHQSGRLEGGRVKAREVQVIRNAAGDSSIFVRRDGSRQRNNQAQTHLLCSMAMGTIQRIRIDKGRIQIVHEARIRIIRIQAQHTAVDHTGIIALSVL